MIVGLIFVLIGIVVWPFLAVFGRVLLFVTRAMLILVIGAAVLIRFGWITPLP